jgi:hypothetical protein
MMPDIASLPDGDLEERLTQLREDTIRLSHQLAAVTGKADSALSEVVRAHSRIDSLPTGVGAVDEYLRRLFYKLVGNLRELKETDSKYGHKHSYTVFKGPL